MAKEKKATPAPQTITLKIVKRGVQLRVGSADSTAYELIKFTSQVQELLRNQPLGTSLACVPLAGVAAQTIKPEQASPAPGAKPICPLSEGVGGQPATVATVKLGPGQHRVTKYMEGVKRICVDPPVPPHGKNSTPKSEFECSNLGLGDVVLGARPGAVFSEEGCQLRLESYALNVQPGLGASPSIDRNPFNFAEWTGNTPWGAEAPMEAVHSRETKGHLSGSIKITYEARSPVFIPGGDPGRKPPPGQKRPPPDPDEEHGFWHAHHPDGTLRYGLPGSSLKGAVRSVFEALTNSRMGVNVTENLRVRHVYRRRAAKLFRIDTLPTATTPGTLSEVPFEYATRQGGALVFVQDRAPVPANWSKVDWRANLFFVDRTRYSHGAKTHIVYDPSKVNGGFTLDWAVWQTYQQVLKDHPHLVAHPDNVERNSATSRYKDASGKKLAPPYDATVRNGLFDLGVGDLIHGIATGSAIVCFGRNVNFLWPAAQSPLDLIGPFAARDPEKGATLETSDSAEATFGFITDDDKKAMAGRSFRGRVRFTTFWAPPDASPQNRVKLMPLTAPPGPRAKSQPLYLAPAGVGPNAKSAAYADPSPVLKGRKFYWHQKSPDDDVPFQHRYDKLRRTDGPDVQPRLMQPWIRTLPTGTTFTGEAQFTNLDPIELGALLISLAPHVGFGAVAGPPSHGIKVGKGKPRGLGSLVATNIALHILTDPVKRYSRLEAPNEEDQSAEIPNHVRSYQTWAEKCSAKKSWREIGFVMDLEKLLRLPTSPSVRVYPPRFADYAWSPDWNDPNGDPKRVPGRPLALQRARDDK